MTLIFFTEYKTISNSVRNFLFKFSLKSLKRKPFTMRKVIRNSDLVAYPKRIDF